VEDPRYREQILEGAGQILKEAKKLAAEAAINIEKAEWDDGNPILERENHSLSITANAKTIAGLFPDEWLADYPGGVGNEKANAVLSEIIKKLR